MAAIDQLIDANQCYNTALVDCTKVNSWGCQSDCTILKNCLASCTNLYGFPCADLLILERGYCKGLSASLEDPYTLRGGGGELTFVETHQPPSLLSTDEIIGAYSVELDPVLYNNDEPLPDEMEWKHFADPCRDTGNPNIDCFSLAWDENCSTSCPIITNCKMSCNKNMGIKCMDMYFMQDMRCSVGDPTMEAPVSANPEVEMMGYGMTDACSDEPGYETICKMASPNSCRQDCKTILNCHASCTANAIDECDGGRSPNSCGLDCDEMLRRKQQMTGYCSRRMNSSTF